MPGHIPAIFFLSSLLLLFRVYLFFAASYNHWAYKKAHRIEFEVNFFSFSLTVANSARHTRSESKTIEELYIIEASFANCLANVVVMTTPMINFYRTRKTHTRTHTHVLHVWNQTLDQVINNWQYMWVTCVELKYVGAYRLNYYTLQINESRNQTSLLFVPVSGYFFCFNIEN